MLRSVPRDWASVLAFTEALAGLPWVMRERQVIPAHVEHGLRLLEEPQRHSPARRYVGCAGERQRAPLPAPPRRPP